MNIGPNELSILQQVRNGPSHLSTKLYEEEVKGSDILLQTIDNNLNENISCHIVQYGIHVLSTPDLRHEIL